MSPSAPRVSWTCPGRSTRALCASSCSATRPTGTGAAARPAVAVSEVAVRGLAPPRPDAGGTFASHCGALALRAGPSVATARVSGTLAALDAGRPLRLAGCGRRALLDLPSGASRVVAAPGRDLACGPPGARRARARAAAAAGGPGAVVRAGTEGDGSHDHVRLRLDKPAWLVYGESYSSGWRAWCRNTAGKEQSLGAPVPIDGFANGWRVGADCREARFAFAPQRLADAAYLVSGVACVGMLLILLVPALRRRRAGAVVPARPRPRRAPGRRRCPLLPTPIACSGRIRSLRSPAASQRAGWAGSPSDREPASWPVSPCACSSSSASPCAG